MYFVLKDIDWAEMQLIYVLFFCTDCSVRSGSFLSAMNKGVSPKRRAWIWDTWVMVMSTEGLARR